jgi:ferric-dicitrate binding protein FerR (iron transport regulator)
MTEKFWGLRDGATLRVLSGKVAPAEAIALLAALDLALAYREEAAVDRSAWRRAARMEALGGRPAAAPSDVGPPPHPRPSGPRRRRGAPAAGSQPADGSAGL